jgi:hypothetical protein
MSPNDLNVLIAIEKSKQLREKLVLSRIRLASIMERFELYFNLRIS